MTASRIYIGDCREWSGWGTALKPAWEPIILARKPLAGTVEENVRRHGTGALNIDACRVPASDDNYGNAIVPQVAAEFVRAYLC